MNKTLNRREFHQIMVSAGLSSIVGVPTTMLSEKTATSGVRARDIGIAPGIFSPGSLNAITDVQDVLVGHTTLIDGPATRTGVTAILPHGGNIFRDKVLGAVYVGNAFGKLTGSTQVEELGTIETPIILTNTLNVGTATEAVVAYTLNLPGNEDAWSVNAVVGETNDYILNDIRGLHVKPEHVLAAIQNAHGGPVSEGCVGAGTGTICFGWKGGIGTSSRKLPTKHGAYSIGVLVQTNYGGMLTMAGVPVGKELGRMALDGVPISQSDHLYSADGSCMVVVATDAPLDSRGLYRLAKRAVFGLGRTGSAYSNGSGDYAIAFSTFRENRVFHSSQGVFNRKILSNDSVSPIFEAALESVEEAVYNSLLQARTMTGNGHTIEALPIDRLRMLLRKYGVGGLDR